MIRHHVLLLSTLIFLVSPLLPAVETAPVRIGITPVLLDSQTALIGRWRTYIEARLQRPVVFKQRQTYRQVIDMLAASQLDFAWVCGFPYVKFRKLMKLLAVPVYQGKPLYQSYLIVPAGDRSTRSIEQLRGKIFAYSDPDSNSGFLVPQYQLHHRGLDRTTFFARTFFTWAHQKVVQAVAAGLADGGAVDGYIWDTMARSMPQVTDQTRVVAKSRQFGFPPLVARRGVPVGEFSRLQKVLFGMRNDPQGTALLRELNLDGFGRGDDSLYEDIALMANALQGAGRVR